MGYNTRMLTIIRTSLILFLLFCTQSSWAILHLTLNQGVNSAVPIAVLSFTGETASDNLSSVVAADLQNSGRFKNEAQQDMTSNTEVSNADLAQWKQQHVNYVIDGSVQTTPNNRLQVSVAVYDVYKNNESNDQTATPILQQQFNVDPSNVRQLAHYISDLVYQKLLGARGVFSTKIAYIAVQDNDSTPTYQLMIADYDGENAAPVLISKQPIMSPTWSPDGNSVAYVSFENGFPAIYISNINTGKRRLIINSAGLNSAPNFSPDGRQLAVVLTRASTPAIYTINLQTGALRKITRVNAINTAPQWSANGKKILFTSDRGGTPQLYDINVASKVVQRLTFNGDYNANGQWINGKNIVYLHRGDDSNDQFVIATQNIANSNIRLLSSGNAQSPSVAPNGSMVIYNKLVSPGVSQLAMLSTDGRVRLQLPSSEGSVQSPAWSPFLPAGNFS